MHRGHDHNHNAYALGPALAGHNRPAPANAVQWQTPHNPSHDADHDHAPEEADLDLVETAFAESFSTASDPTSFLRLAHVPFEARDSAGATLSMLRVEIDQIADVGSVTPSLGGGPMRYDPLPAQMVTRRRKLRFVYFDGRGTRALSLADVRALNSV